MSDCLHCDINDLVQKHVEGGTNDLVEIASMMAESLADLVLLAPEDADAGALRLVLERAGVEFIPEDSGGVGVRFAKPSHPPDEGLRPDQLSSENDG